MRPEVFLKVYTKTSCHVDQGWALSVSTAPLDSPSESMKTRTSKIAGHFQVGVDASIDTILRCHRLLSLRNVLGVLEPCLGGLNGVPQTLGRRQIVREMLFSVSRRQFSANPKKRK